MPTRSKQPSADVERRILALGADTHPRTRLGTRRATAIAIVVVLTLVAAMPLRPDLGALPMVRFALVTAAVLTVSTLAVAAAAFSRRATGPAYSVLVATAVLVPIAYAVVTVVVPVRAMGRFVSPPTGMCLAMAAMVGAAGLAGMLAAFRRAVPVSPVTRGAAFGAAAGAWAGLAMHLRCPSVDPIHIVLGHSLPIALVAIVGAAIAPRVVRP